MGMKGLTKLRPKHKQGRRNKPKFSATHPCTKSKCMDIYYWKWRDGLQIGRDCRPLIIFCLLGSCRTWHSVSSRALGRWASFILFLAIVHWRWRWRWSGNVQLLINVSEYKLPFFV